MGVHPEPLRLRLCFYFGIVLRISHKGQRHAGAHHVGTEIPSVGPAKRHRPTVTVPSSAVRK